MSNRLGRVDQEENSLLAGNVAHCGRRLDCPGHIGNVVQDNEPGAARQGALDLICVNDAIRAANDATNVDVAAVFEPT